ncbi:hypothetical protein BDN72DRAFT_880571 [Pluteus cervinus]|uniref:Uncharacterized protein n=1 Tax=Pluteus cervinus TaxID=181527 RepID=A0ACD3AJH4_9AGAR|nr:hypothetical protein BDN72DRAFT_880571 [Pluteus cervinus]
MHTLLQITRKFQTMPPTIIWWTQDLHLQHLPALHLTPQAPGNQSVYHGDTEEMLKKVQKDLVCLNYLQSHIAAFKQTEEGTGQWFLNTKEFQDWKQGCQVRALLGSGDPGAGKTCILSLVINLLQQLQKSGHPTVARVAYFYLHHQDAKIQSPANIVATLLKQLLLSYSSLPESALILYEQLELEQGPPQLEVLVTTLLNICQDKQFTTYIVLDALDECMDTYQPELISVLQQLLTVDVRLFATCRSAYQDIMAPFKGPHCVKLTIQASQEDVARFLKKKLESKESFKSIMTSQFQEEVISDIQSKTNGV